MPRAYISATLVTQAGQIADGAVTTPKLADSAVTIAKSADEVLLLAFMGMS